MLYAEGLVGQNAEGVYWNREKFTSFLTYLYVHLMFSCQLRQVGFVDDDRDKDKGSDDDHNKDEWSDDDHDEDEGSDDDHGLRFDDEFLEIARLDDRHGLIKLMEGSYRSSESVFGYLSKGAVNCVTALLEGEVGPPMELSVDPKFGKCPLHVATNNMSYSIVDLLLRYGARTDLKSKAMAITRGGLLPLNVALEKLR